MQRLLAGPMQVKHGLALAGLANNVEWRGLIVTVWSNEVGRRVEDVVCAELRISRCSDMTT
jgi:hypothetical protein